MVPLVAVKMVQMLNRPVMPQEFKIKYNSITNKKDVQNLDLTKIVSEPC